MILKTDVGLAYEVVEADFAVWSDDQTRLDFVNVDATGEALRTLASLMDSTRERTSEEAAAELMDMLRAIGQITIASFPREALAGYRRGLRLDVEG